MSAPKLSIVFFGTGPVSAATLAGIHNSFHIEAIVTKPRMTAPGGKPLPHPVLDLAEQHGWPTTIVAGKAELAAAVATRPFQSRIGLVVDFGIIIPAPVIDSFPLGILNSHFSLLPLLRGADPISTVIRDGLEQTGVSLMTIVPALDEGPLLWQEHINVPPSLTTPDLTDMLVALSNKIVQEQLPRYYNGSIKPYSQDNTIAPTYTHKLKKSDGIIDWALPAEQIERQIRAFIGWPGSRTVFSDRDVIITKAHLSTEATPGQTAGDFDHTSSGELTVRCGAGALIIDALKPSGKTEMPGKAFLSGLR